MNDSVLKMPLRRRLFLTMFSLVLAALTVSSVAFYFMSEHLESTVLGIFMEQEMAVVKDHLDEYPGEALPRISSLKAYLEDEAGIPGQVRGFEPGQYHDIRIGDNRYEVLVDRVNGTRVWLLFDINRVESVANFLFFLLAGLFVVLTAIAVWLSFRLSRRMAAPVGRLADRVEQLTPQDTDVRLAQEFRGEEVERIARAFDRYLERLQGFVDREQSFTAAASHELRTPLAVIRGAAEILEASLTEPRLQKTLERIQRASREMSEFIEALLSLSREEHVSSYRAETRVDEICRNVCEDMSATLARRSNLIMDCQFGTPVTVAAPPSLVAITLSNLVRNALEHTENGRIEVRLEKNRFTVRDTGSGIPPEVLERIHERHFSTRGGSGMGLYLVRRICDRYGWKLHVQSTVGKGTTVVLEFR